MTLHWPFVPHATGWRTPPRAPSPALRVVPPPVEPLGVTVIVQGVPGRGVAWERSRESIEQSDIGTSYELMLHPEGLSATKYFLSVMQRMSEAPTPLVLRFEDDAIVNRHVLYNCGTWPALQDPRFGAGWLLAPGGAGTNIIDYIYHRKSDGLGRWWKRERLHASVGVLLRTADVPALTAWLTSHMTDVKGAIGQDIALSSAVFRMGKRIVLHNPSLVEHPVAQSSLGHWTHRRNDTSAGTFMPDWRRKR